MLPAGGTAGLLRAGGEGGVLPPGPDIGDVRLPVAGSLPAERSGATAEAWKEFHVRLRAFVSRQVKSRTDVEDIVQGVFMQMHRSLPALRTRDRLGPWLYRSARNAVIDHYRKPARRREVPSGDTRELERMWRPLAPAHDDESPAQELAAACLTPMIGRLPERYRRAIELVELRGVSQKEAAEIEGVSLSGMKTRVQRARRQLKASLLECCRIALDARGGVMACHTRASARTPCGCSAREGNE